MGRVKILPPEVAGKIAAGEVVERPASVVKELVENSLDAGATRIRISTEEGGKKSIRVEDDGCGMSREDTLICFERHATSKITEANDLLRISTRGFRGEALPSIAEVSRLQLWTNDLSGEAGTYVRILGGQKERVEDAALPRGTIVQVDDLFFNFPAREKFMKTPGGEAGHIARTVELAALSAPGVFVSLTSGGRKQLQCEAAGSARERIVQVLGARREILELEEVSGPFRWHGFIEPPLERSVERPFQHFFVNGRPVKDRTLMFALRRAYQEYLQKDINPSAVLYLTVDPGVVDVNVHPTKTEVKFLDSSDAFRSLLNAVKRRLGRLQTFVSVHLDPAGPAPPRPLAPLTPMADAGSSAPRALSALVTPMMPLPPVEPSQLPLTSTRSLQDEPFSILGQYMDSFIVLSMPDGILVIDQHNAHERALYEEYSSRFDRLPAQKFLLPPVMDLSEGAFAKIMEEASQFERYGLVVEEVGPRSIAIREAPPQLGEDGAVAFLSEIVRAAESGDGRDFRSFLEFHLLRSLACHSAIKINTPLTLEKMERIVRNLFATSTPMVCPHGRPIIVKLRLEEILRGLRRKTEGGGVA